MAELTAGDRHILTHPPTPATWACGRKSKTTKLEDGLPVEIELSCRGVMSGSHKVCTHCRRPMRRGARLLWPAYEAACKKAGIETGTRWPIAAPIPAVAPRPTKRKGA